MTENGKKIRGQLAEIERYFAAKAKYLANHGLTGAEWIAAGKPGEAEMKEAATS